MRLWHEALIPLLPRQQLLGLHRETCALRGKGWGRKPAIRLHSANPVGVANMHRIIDRNGWKEIR